MRGGRRIAVLAAGLPALVAAAAAWSGAASAQPDRAPGPAAVSTGAPRSDARPCRRPADVVDLTNWSVTLPSASAPITVTQPALATTSVDPSFVAQGCAIQFSAPVTSATTAHSRYPRSELREMTDGGRLKAAWSSGQGRHELDVDLAFTRLPLVKPHVVGAQVHDRSDDVMTLRLEGSKLWITHRDRSHAVLVTDAYRLGTRLQVRFVVEHDALQAFVDGRLVATFADVVSGGYFKTGAYVQANCSNSAPCDASNGGAVLLYALGLQSTP